MIIIAFQNYRPWSTVTRIHNDAFRVEIHRNDLTDRLQIFKQDSYIHVFLR